MIIDVNRGVYLFRSGNSHTKNDIPIINVSLFRIPIFNDRFLALHTATAELTDIFMSRLFPNPNMTFHRIPPSFDPNNKPQQGSNQANQLQTVQIICQTKEGQNDANACSYCETLS